MLFVPSMKPESASSQGASPNSQNDQALGGSVHRVLLVEDNETNQMVVIDMLEDTGYEVVVANNGREALELLEANEYDAILMDCHMPGMDGFAATVEIRARENAGSRKRVPIVAVTANASTADRNRCLETGMDDYLSKPFGIDDLVNMLNRWVAN